VALLLWIFPLTTAKKLLAPPVAEPAPAASPDTWLAMGCALIGLWLLATAIPVVVRDALYFYSSASEYDDFPGFRRWLIYRLVEILVAVWLIVGTKGFVKVFQWSRGAGINKST